MPLVATPPRSMDPHHVMRRMYEEDLDSLYGLSESASCPSTPDSFIVTPEGKALPGVRNIIADPQGHLMSKFMVDKVWDSDAPIIREVQVPRFGTNLGDSPAAIPIEGLQSEHLPISWEDHPMITWTAQEPFDRHRYVEVYNVGEDGTTYKTHVPLRKYVSEHRDADTGYVVDKFGEVRYAHTIMVPQEDGMHVVMRGDDDTGGLFDEVPIPDLVIRPFYDVVYISEPNGEMHTGCNCMVGTPEGIVVYARCARWERSATTPMSPLLTYDRKFIMPKKRDPCDVIDSFTLEKDGVVTEYKKVLLAQAGKVLISYQTGNDNDLVITSEDGTVVRLVEGKRHPVATPYHDVVYITSQQGVTFPGLNILIATPMGHKAVATVASFGEDRVLKSVVSVGLRGVPGYVEVAGLGGKKRLAIAGSKYPAIKASLKQERDKLLYDTAEKCDKCKHQRVTIASADEVKYTTLYPNKSSEVEVFIAGPEMMLGHSIMYMGNKGCCEVRFIKD
eukprot:TRINITY_DN16664_c0_g1_i1.p1 TRINITY_DN16664_c0_g1~~TRINITY_DN16664_c0_g1_i1.p1  ORF type:complete len:503 (+),score=192.77 TRINITY_DN16664_c0_g1_i1:51-1559(+)